MTMNKKKYFTILKKKFDKKKINYKYNWVGKNKYGSF